MQEPLTALDQEPSKVKQLLGSLLTNDTPDQIQAHFENRLKDKKIQITNPDRPRPKPGNGDETQAIKAQRKLLKRKTRVKRELTLMKRMRIEANKSLRVASSPIKTTAANNDLKKNFKSIPAVQDHPSNVQEQQRKLAKVKKELIKVNKPNSAKKLDKDWKKPLTRSQRKKLGLEQVDYHVSYELLLPLHKLWCSYIQQLLNITALDSKGNMIPNPQFSVQSLNTMASGTVSTVQASLIKADLCGAQVEVVRSANPSLVSLVGLVVKETEQTLIITLKPRQDSIERRSASKGKEIRVIPKRNTVFTIHIPLAQNDQYICFELHGNHMMHTLPSRATRKYKAKTTIDF